MTKTAKQPIIRLTDSKALADAIAAVEGRATQRTVGLEFVEDACEAAEQALSNLGILMADRIGSVVEVNGSEKLPSAYGHAAQATYVYMIRARDDWRFQSATRGHNAPRARDWQLTVTPSDEALIAGAKRMLTNR